MSKCIGVKGEVCYQEFFDPIFTEDNICDKCAELLEGDGDE